MNAGEREACPFCDSTPCAHLPECSSYAALLHRNRAAPPWARDAELEAELDAYRDALMSRVRVLPNGGIRLEGGDADRSGVHACVAALRQEAREEALKGERIYWHPDMPEDGRSELDTLLELLEDVGGDKGGSGIERIERAMRLPDGWVAITPDPTDPDCQAITEHETEAEAKAAVEARTAHLRATPGGADHA